MISFTEKTNNRLIYGLMVISFGWMGISMLMAPSVGGIAKIANFYGLSSLSPDSLHMISAALLVVAAALSLMMILTNNHKGTLKKLLAGVMAVISIPPLVALFSDHMWIEKLGGFPAIGSGQGIIKYFAPLAIALTIAYKDRLTVSQIRWINLFPVLLVLIWIGGMKFTLLEAKGIEVLAKISPLMSWMYSVWDLQMTSNVIGVYDLLAVVLLIACVKYTKLMVPAITLSGSVFVVTQTFLISWPAAVTDTFLLSGGGQFIIKDLWFIANLLIFWHTYHGKPWND